MKAFIAALFASFLFAGSAFAACFTDTTLSVFGKDGSNGLINTDGTPGYGSGSVIGQMTNDLNDLDGVAHLKGSSDCASAHDVAKAVEDAQNESAALAAALAQPTYLGDREQFAVSGGLGFSDGEVAGGATVIGRLNRNVSAYAGGAVGSDNWAAKTGLRVGW